MKRDAAIVSTASNFATSWIKLAFAIVTGIIVTRSLGPELKGQYSNLQLILSLYVPFLIFGYPGGVLYYGLRSIIDLRKFFWSGFLLVAVLGAILTPLVFVLVSNGFMGEIAGEIENRSLMLALSVAPIVLLNAYCERVLRSYHQFRTVNLRTIIGAAFTLAYFIAALIVVGIELQQAIIGILVGQSVQLALNVWFVVNSIQAEWCINPKNLFMPWRYGIKTWFNQIIAKSNDRFDPIALTFMLAAGPFGIYCVGVGLSNMLTQIPSSYVNVFFNQIAERSSEDAVDLYAKAQRITFAITICMAIALAVLAYPLIYLMYGSEFTAAAWVVVFYLPGLVFQVAARLSIKLYAGMGRPLKNSLVYLIGFLVSLPFYFLLIPRYGINGAAISSSIAYFSAFLFSYTQIRREFGLPLREIIGVRKDDVRYVQSQLSRLPVIRNWMPA